MMGVHTLKPAQAPDKGWSVGYWVSDQSYQGGRVWNELCAFPEQQDALNRVNILNGGPGLQK